MREITFNGAWGWSGIALFVLAYDTWAMASGRETLSAAFGRALAHPRRRWPVLAAWGLTTLHLCGRLPDMFDPFDQYAAILAIVQTHRPGYSGACLSVTAGVQTPDHAYIRLPQSHRSAAGVP